MPYSDLLDVRVTDTSLRDGSHAKRHQFTEDQVRSVVRALDAASIPVADLGVRRPSLDDVFLSLTGHHAEEAPVRGGPPGRRRAIGE